MNVRRLVPVLALAVTLPLAAVAQSPVPADPKPASATAEPAAAQAKNEKPRFDANCLQTGTRIVPRKDKQGRCAPGPGRAYSSEDLARTGETNVADALRKLDPSIY